MFACFRLSCKKKKKKKKEPMNFPAPHQESICLLHHSSTHIPLYQMQNTPAGPTKAHVLCTVTRGNKPIPTAGGNSLKQSGNSDKSTQQHRGEQLTPPQRAPTDTAYKPQPCKTHCRDFGIGADRSLEDFTRAVEWGSPWTWSSHKEIIWFTELVWKLLLNTSLLL